MARGYFAHKSSLLAQSYIIWTVVKTVDHVLVTKANVSIMKRCMPEKCSHTAHPLYALLLTHMDSAGNLEW